MGKAKQTSHRNVRNVNRGRVSSVMWNVGSNKLTKSGREKGFRMTSFFLQLGRELIKCHEVRGFGQV